MDKSEKIIICGKSGAGKDYLMRYLTKEGLIPSVKYTTRPKRSLETDGVEYNFVNENQFHQMKMVVNQSFLNSEGARWEYGISKDDFETSQSFIMTPGEITQLNKDQRKKCFIVYLDIDRNIRENRIIKRNDSNDSIKRRLDADEIDFKDFTDYDLRISEPDFDLRKDGEVILSLMS